MVSMQTQEIIDKLELIASDMEQDAKDFEGKPFDGKTVATYFGYQGAAIAAIANLLKEVLKHKQNHG